MTDNERALSQPVQFPRPGDPLKFTGERYVSGIAGPI